MEFQPRRPWSLGEAICEIGLIQRGSRVDCKDDILALAQKGSTGLQFAMSL